MNYPPGYYENLADAAKAQVKWAEAAKLYRDAADVSLGHTRRAMYRDCADACEKKEREACAS